MQLQIADIHRYKLTDVLLQAWYLVSKHCSFILNQAWQQGILLRLGSMVRDMPWCLRFDMSILRTLVLQLHGISSSIVKPCRWLNRKDREVRLMCPNAGRRRQAWCEEFHCEALLASCSSTPRCGLAI